MKQLIYELRQLCLSNRAYSYVTQANREDMLTQMGHQLISLGYAQLHATEIKGRHVHRLFKLWREQNISDRTIENRLSVLRWWCRRVGRPSVMPKTNEIFHLTPRPKAAVVSKAITLSEDQLCQVDDAYVQMSLRLQKHWGLRAEESLKIRPWQADQGEYLALQGSWCKNGRAREVPLVWPEQREVLDRAKALVRFKSHSLIPLPQYHQQRRRYYAWAEKLGFPPLHGQRHCFAQRRFEMLAGFPCPLQGGPVGTDMTPAQSEHDRRARQQVSRELGHERLAIVGLYIGAK